MRDADRLAELAREAGAYERERLPTVEPPRRDSITVAAGDQPDAREKLVLQRTGSTYYKDPAKQRRNILRSKEKKAALNDTSGWVFTQAERFAVLDKLIRQGDRTGLAQAVLTADPQNLIDVNKTYVSDDQGNSRVSAQSNEWLNLVALRNDVNYIRLLCAAGASQQSRDQALGKALGRQAYQAAQELFRSRANPNTPETVEFFERAIAEQQIPLINMFLTSIVPLEQRYLDEALVATVGRGTPELVALLFAHGANGDFGEGHALCKAIAGSHLEDAATVLFYSDHLLSSVSREKAVSATTFVNVDATQHKLFEMLLWSGAEPNSSDLLEQLMRAVKDGRRSFVELLIMHGTSADENDAECLRWAIASEQMAMVEILLRGDVSVTSASKALQESRALEELEMYEYVVMALLDKGVEQDSLHQCLATAVQKNCNATFAQTLISRGANIDHAQASCVQTALQRNNLTLFRVLLQGQSNPSILCKVLPSVMNIQPQSDRFDVMNALLDKGVSGKELHIALQTVVNDAENAIDYRLLHLLIRRNASVDFSNKQGNCVCIAVAHNNGRALDLLVEGRPNSKTASAALGVLRTSFRDADAPEYEETIRMAQTLLERGARGIPTAQMLVEAARSDLRGKALDLLLNYGADANFQEGKAIEEALLRETIAPLESLCHRTQLVKTTFAKQIPNALNVQNFDLEKSKLLVHTAAAHGHQDVLDQPLLDEIQNASPRTEVVKMLLDFGANVNHKNGEGLRHAVSQGDVQHTQLLLSGNPTTVNVARAFPATMQISDLTTRYALMQSLLHSGGPGMGDEALVQAAREANPSDLSHVELLLQHDASPNFKDGAPVIEAVRAINLPLIDIFLRTKPNTTTLSNAFNLARAMECSWQDRYQIFSRLLNTGSSGFKTDLALIEVVKRLPTDVQTSTLLLENGASVDANNGKAMQLAAEAASLDLLRIFLNRQPLQKSRDMAFDATIHAALDVATKRDVYDLLLASGITTNFTNTALFEATRLQSIDHSLINLLLKFHPSLDAHDGGAVYNSAASGEPETLRILLTAEVANKGTLDRAFEKCMELRGATRYDMAKQLLEKRPGVNTDVVSRFLAQVVTERDNGLLELMAVYQPDPGYNEGTSIVIAAEQGDVVSTAILTKLKIASPIRNKAFVAMLDTRTIRSSPDGLRTAELLLQTGIDQALIDRTLLDGFDNPIDQHTKDLVQLLTRYKPDFNGDQGKAFVAAALSRELELFRHMACQNPNLDIVIPALIEKFGSITIEEIDDEDVNLSGSEVLVEKTPSNDAEDPSQSKTTLNQTVTVEDVIDEDFERRNNATEPRPEVSPEDVYSNVRLDSSLQGEARESYQAFVDNDFQHDGHVDYHEGFGNGENQETEQNKSRRRQTPEERLVFFLLHIDDCSNDKTIMLDDFILFTAITKFPQGVLLVDHLLNHGCRASSKAVAMTDPSGQLLRYSPPDDPEEMTAVMWALTCEEPVVSEDVILEILKRGPDADPLFETPGSGVTATILASAADRRAVLLRLIEIGVELSKCNIYGHTASFYASRNGHYDIVDTLHAAGTKVDDGSLQEAARESHPEIVELLLARGHRPDYPSAVHADDYFGRTALEELCLKSTPGDDFDAWKSSTHKCIEQLLPKMLQDIPKTDGKTMLHLAVRNENPVPVTHSLLEFSRVWENINHTHYLFRDEQGYHYSPTKYVELLCEYSNHDTQQQLISLLRAKKCDDKFYAHTVEQPLGAVGLPEEIAKAVEQQRRADFEHKEAIRRQDDLSARLRRYEAEDHDRRVAKDRERHDAIIRQNREQDEEQQQAARRKHQTALNHGKELSQQRQTAIEEEAQMREDALSQEAAHRKRIKSFEQSADLAHQKNMAGQELATVRAKAQVEEQIANERVAASRREAEIVMNILSKREATARYERQQREASNY